MPKSNLGNQPPPHFEESLREGHEPLTINVRWLVIGAIGILLVLVGSMALMYWLTVSEARRPHLPSGEAPVEWTQKNLPPDPHVDPNQAHELTQLTEANEELLSSYGWIDRRQGVVRIPVDRAIELLAKSGSPTLRLDSDAAGEQPSGDR